MTFRSLALAAALGTAVPLAALAHGPKVGHSGGPQADAGAFLEILPQGTTLAVYLRDHADKDGIF
jgi:hypothetical protein